MCPTNKHSKLSLSTKTLTMRSGPDWTLMILTSFSLIPPEEFSGSSLTQKWNVGVTLAGSHFHPPWLFTASCCTTHFFPRFFVSQEMCSPATCTSTAKSYLKQCPLLLSVQSARLDGQHWVTPKLRAPVVTRVLMRGQASLQGSRWHTILQKRRNTGHHLWWKCTGV